MAITPELSRVKKRLGVTLVLAIGVGTLSLYESSILDSSPSSAAVQHMAKLSTQGTVGGASIEPVNKAEMTASTTITTEPTPTTSSTTSTTAATATTTATTPPPTPAEQAAAEVTPAEYAAWSRVNQCEESGNWHINGTVYAGGLGISRTNWSYYGGQRDFGDEASATPQEQIVVAMRIQSNPPDQNGVCAGW